MHELWGRVLVRSWEGGRGGTKWGDREGGLWEGAPISCKIPVQTPSGRSLSSLGEEPGQEYYMKCEEPG